MVWRTSTAAAGLVLALIVLRANAAAIPSEPDDPCTNGWCSWSTGDGENQAFANLVVNGGVNALSDISPAAGWKIDGCPTDWKDGEMKVMMTCTDDTKCNHVFNGGAQDTLVRLPEECGKGPFARIMECSLATKGKRAATGQPTTIKTGMQWSATLSFDMSTKPHDEAKGPVMMYLTGSNVKSAADVLSKRWAQDLHTKRGEEDELFRRSFFSNIGNAIKGTVDKAANDVKKVGEAVATDAKKAAAAVETDAKKAATDVKKVASAAVTEVKKAAAAVQKDTTFNKTETDKIKPITVQKNFPIFDKSFSCGSITADLNMNVDATLNANVGFGFTIIGSIVPPELKDLSVQATLNGNVEATFNIGVGVQGSFDTGLITLLNLPLTPLEIPGVASIGPVASINAELTAQMDIEAQLAVNTGFSLPNINLIFPPDKGKSTGSSATQSVSKQPIKVSVGDGTVNANGNIDAHLIPRLDFGIEVLKFAKATVFLELDASGTLTMTLNAASKAARRRGIDFDKRAILLIDGPSVPTPTRTEEERSLSLEQRARQNSVSGTVALDGSIFISGGLDGSLGSLFSKSLNFPIFQFTKNIFTKNFGTPAARSLAQREELAVALRRRAAAKKAAPAKPAPAKAAAKKSAPAKAAAKPAPEKPAAKAATKPAVAPAAKKPGPAAKLKQKISTSCFSSGSFLGGGGVKGFISSLIPVPL